MNERVMTLDTLHAAFAARFNAGDIEGLLALNAPGAVLVPAPGQPLSEPDAVRGGLEQFMALGGPIEMALRHVFVSGSIGLAIADWTLKGTAPDGSPVELAGSTSDVAVFDEEHGWRIVIDNPFGTA